MITQNEAPIFIGGSNGSGTRVYAMLLEKVGIFQGQKKNFAFEPENIIQYTKPLVPKLMEFTRAPTYDIDTLPFDLRFTMDNWIRKCAEELKTECPSNFTHWGWKHPRNLFLVPLLHQVFPNCYFVQVIRDGRDMAFANNKGDARTLYQSLFSPTSLQAQHYTQFWSKVNCEVAQWCEINLGDRFVWSRFEDLCLQPRAELQRIVDELGITLNKETLSQCSEMVVTPCSIGRWRSAPKELQEKLLKSGKEGLYQFKYQPLVHN